MRSKLAVGSKTFETLNNIVGGVVNRKINCAPRRNKKKINGGKGWLERWMLWPQLGRQ